MGSLSYVLLFTICFFLEWLKLKLNVKLLKKFKKKYFQILFYPFFSAVKNKLFIIICLNLKKFKQLIITNHLKNLPYQIKFEI
jgi:hypothetical protein